MGCEIPEEDGRKEAQKPEEKTRGEVCDLSRKGDIECAEAESGNARGPTEPGFCPRVIY